MPLDRPLPDEPREALKMLWSVAEDQQIDINRHRDSIHKVWHVAPAKPREGMLVYADGTDWNPGAGAGYYVYYAGAWHPMSGGGGGGGGYTTVQDEGVALTVRTTLNFVGAGVTATDDGTRTVVTIPGGGAGSVTSVFTRTGAVIAVTGDYTAAQVTNAVSVLGSYPNPTWIPSYAYSKLTGVPTSFTPAAHVHAAADTTSGIFAVARLGSGTPSSANWLRGDGAWTALPAGMTQTPWLSNIAGGSFALHSVSSISIGSAQTTRTGTVLSVIRPTDPAGAAQATQLVIAESSNSAGYQLQMGYTVMDAAYWAGCIQALMAGGGTKLFLNPLGGAIGVNKSTADHALDIAGNVNISGAYLVNGVALSLLQLRTLGLPTSSAGLAAGDIWVDVPGGNVLKIV